MASMQYKIFCVREFIKTESVTAVQSAFRLRFNIQPPTRKSICRWNHQFEQIGYLCKGKSSGRTRVSEEKVRRIQESFERGPRKSTRRATRELGREFVVGVTNLSKQAVCVKAKAPAEHVYQRRRSDEFKRILTVAHASQPVERLENLEYGNQQSGMC